MKYAGKIVSIMGFMLTLSACAPINTQFSCNETARDKCLSFEEAYAMTEKVDKDVPLYGASSNKRDVNQQTIWFAPWKDHEGKLHQGKRARIKQ